MGNCSDCVNTTDYYDDNTKCWCNYYRGYYYPSECYGCKNYASRNGSGSSGCFMTTACCVHKGLPDDCRELTIMRKLRDEWLKNQSFGPNLIDMYYQQAPLLVKAINESDRKEETYEKLYKDISEIADVVETGDMKLATIMYLKMVYSLTIDFLC